MKKTIDRILLFVLGAFSSSAIAVFFPRYTAFIQAHPGLGVGSVALLLIGLIWYWRVAEKQDQRDVKTVVKDVENRLHLPSQCLTDTNVSRIENAPDLASLLNCDAGVTSRVMNKKQRIALPERSCVLQVSFIPIDQNGNTILWKRLPKNHVFKNGTASVLISFSPYARKFSDVFVEDKSISASHAAMGVTCTDLRDIYSREVPHAEFGQFEPVGAYWLPRQKNEKGRYTSPAYCFWVFAVRYDADFNDAGVVDSIFKQDGRSVYLKKDNDKKVQVLPLKELQTYQESEKLKLGKMDAYVAANYSDFVKRIPHSLATFDKKTEEIKEYMFGQGDGVVDLKARHVYYKESRDEGSHPSGRIARIECLSEDGSLSTNVVSSYFTYRDGLLRKIEYKKGQSIDGVVVPSVSDFYVDNSGMVLPASVQFEYDELNRIVLESALDSKGMTNLLPSSIAFSAKYLYDGDEMLPICKIQQVPTGVVTNQFSK